MAIWCIYFMSVPTSILGILSRSNSSIDSSWMAPLMPSVIMMRGLTWFVVVVDFVLWWVQEVLFIVVCVTRWFVSGDVMHGRSGLRKAL